MPFVPFRVGRIPTTEIVSNDRMRRLFDFVNALVDVNGDFLLGDITIGRGFNRVYTNAAFGRNALKLNTTGDMNTAVGNDVLSANTTGIGNTGVGNGTLSLSTTGNYNVGVGFEVLLSNTSGSSNVAGGYQTLRANTIGVENVAIGIQSMYVNTSGNYNVAIGRRPLFANTTGSYNVVAGHEAMYANTIGGYNVAIGPNVLYSNTTGSRNVTIGEQSMYANTTGGFNVAVGADSLGNSTTGSYNASLGNLAGTFQADGVTPLADPENSIYIGASCRGFDNSDSNSIVIGYSAIGEGSNTTVIGSTSTTKTHLHGNLEISNGGEGGVGRLAWRSSREVHTLANAATSDTTTISIPAGCELVGVQMNVNTAVVDDAGDDTWSAAFITGSTTTIVTGAAAAQNTKVDLLVPSEITTATTQIRFTPNGGNFTAGVIEIVAYYKQLVSLADV